MRYLFLFLFTACATLHFGQPSPQEMDAVGAYKIAGGINYAGIATGSGNMYIVSLASQSILNNKIPVGTILTFTPSTTNTGKSELMVTNGKKSTPTFPIYKNKTEELNTMDISAGRLIMVLFDKDRFHLIVKNEDLTNFLVECDGVWVSTKGDNGFCGDCNTQCALGETCLGGNCIPKCTGNKVLCGNTCLDTDLDRNNCGDCGIKCPAGFVCNNGRCDRTCPTPLLRCNDSCVDLKNDENNCGTCGNSCLPGFVCDGGVCKLKCPTKLTNCSLNCVDILTDSNNCGACGLQCPVGYTCKEGACIPICKQGETLCKNICVNSQKDALNCGDCGNSCPSGLVCADGKCQ